MNVLVIGGTGFIGYHVIRRLLSEGHRAGLIALPPIPAELVFSREVAVTLADLEKLDDEGIMSAIRGYDAFVYAAGADDRTTPRKPAAAFFEKANVVPLVRLIHLAKIAGLKSGLVMGSYYTHFNRLWPHMKMAERHPYIRSRVRQQQMGFEAAGRDFRLMFLELPFIFGSIPGRKPLWTPLIRYLNSNIPIFCPIGGTSTVSVETVAMAAVAALIGGTPGSSYPVGEENLKWPELFTKLLSHRKRGKKVHSIPAWLVQSVLKMVWFQQKLQSKESGLDFRFLPQILLKETFLDCQATANILKYKNPGMESVYQETIKASGSFSWHQNRVVVRNRRNIAGR